MKEELLLPIRRIWRNRDEHESLSYGNEANQKWIIVDMGITFADESIPGIDLIYPDAGFIIGKR